MQKKFVLGLDYGTDSVRALIVDAKSGEEVSSGVAYYPRWARGLYCDPAKNMFRQHPLDYIESLEESIRIALKEAPAGTGAGIAGISVDTTGSTIVATNEQGIPLSLLDGFVENPNAMFVLWKDHTAVQEADRINEMARSWGGTDFTMYEGGIYSSEWFWAKIMHVQSRDNSVREQAYSWLEHCDWIPALLTGTRRVLDIKRSRCSAGHKAMWHESWGGLPPVEFLEKLAPGLGKLRGNLYSSTYTSDTVAGYLTAEWADRLGLTAGIPVGVGAFDCHMGAVGGQIGPNTLVRVIGTSTCDILVAHPEEMGDKLVRGICGQVDGSVVPGMIGLEAGQSAFGDIYAWFRDVLAWPVKSILASSVIIEDSLKEKLLQEVISGIIPGLSEQALEIDPHESTVLAIDWMNGRRTPDADQMVKGTITGLSLGSSAPAIFRALVESTAYGSRAISDRFAEEGIRVDSIIGIGGVAKKSPFVMQTMADVLNKPIRVAKSDQACALGAAMFAAVVAGLYPGVMEAQRVMGQGFETEYEPIPENVKVYEKLYNKYMVLGEFTGKLHRE